jgi:hypothetical protein
MRKRILTAIVAVTVLLTASTVQAQRRGKDKGDERDEAKGAPAGMPVPGAVGAGAAFNPLMQVLDADGDGTISAKELRNAVRALKTLDANRDGKLTPDELLPGGAPALPPMGGDKGAAGAAGGGAPAAGAAAGGAPGAGAGPGLGGFGGFGAAGGGGLGGGAPAAAGGMNAGAGVRVPGGGLPAQVGKLMGFDKNRDGKVTKDELPEAMLPLFQRLDLDRDGAIDIRELRALRAG